MSHFSSVFLLSKLDLEFANENREFWVLPKFFQKNNNKNNLLKFYNENKYIKNNTANNRLGDGLNKLFMIASFPHQIRDGALDGK